MAIGILDWQWLVAADVDAGNGAVNLDCLICVVAFPLVSSSLFAGLCFVVAVPFATVGDEHHCSLVSVW